MQKRNLAYVLLALAALAVGAVLVNKAASSFANFQQARDFYLPSP